MNCPFCQIPDTKVIDSRYVTEGNTVRRRRKCEACGRRFTTFETIEIDMPVVVKNDGRRETYSREKITQGIKKACQKRPVATTQIEAMINVIEKCIMDLNEKEVTSRFIGNLVMGQLRSLDPVAYVRFASVYRTFQDIEEFIGDLQHDNEVVISGPLSQISKVSPDSLAKSAEHIDQGN